MEKKTDADMQVDLDRLYNLVEQLDKNNQSALKLHYNALMKALELNPKSPIVNVTAANFMINKAGDIENGLKYMDKALEYNPMKVSRYEETANLYYELGRVYSEKGDKIKARQYIERVIKLPEDIVLVNQRAVKPVQLNQNTLDYIEKAKALLQ
jgi:tetratricopeptide (TPR) repeat protein